MAEAAKRVTILNQRAGKVVLPPDPEDLENDPKAKARVLLSGQAIEVSAEEAPKYLRYQGLIDASKLVSNVETAEVKKLKADLAAAKEENEKLKAGGPSTEDAELGDGDAVITPAGDKGVIVKVKKKGMANVKLENGNTSAFKLKDLKADPDATQS